MVELNQELNRNLGWCPKIVYLPSFFIFANIYLFSKIADTEQVYVECSFSYDSFQSLSPIKKGLPIAGKSFIFKAVINAYYLPACMMAA